MGFIGVQPASVPLTASDITDGIVSNAKLGADSVNAAKISDDSISEEHLDNTAITGFSALTSLADTDKFLVSDASDSNNLKYVEKQYLGGGGLVLLTSSSDYDGAATQFYATNVFSSTYDNYYVTGFIAPSSDAEIRLRWTTGGGTTQYTTADYNWNSSAYYVDSSHGKAYQENGYHAESYIPICVADIDSDGDSSAGSFSFTIAAPNTNILDRPYVHGLSVFRNGGSIKLYGERFVGANEADPNATGFMLYLSSGNLRDYSISVYGCKK